VRCFYTVCRLLAALLATLLLIGAAPRPQQAATAVDRQHITLLPDAVANSTPPTLSAASYALLEPISGTLLAAGDADTRRPMASTTKIMTAMVVLERCAMEETVTVHPEAVGIEGSSIYLFAGEQITVKTLLYALLLASANDAAAALAYHVAGGIAPFAALMNEKATALGLCDTHFCNPHGLHHEEHYTTARELALLTAAAMAEPAFAEIVATKRYSASMTNGAASRLFVNHNRLLSSLEGAIGVKTGFTKAGGRCLVSAASREGLTLIAVTLNDPADWRDHTALMDWGFSAFEALTPVPMPSPLPVVGGCVGSVAIRPSEAPMLLLSATHPALSCTVELPRFLYAGFAAGEVVGRAIYRMGDRVLAEIPLITAEGVDALPTRPTLWERVRNLFRRY